MLAVAKLRFIVRPALQSAAIALAVMGLALAQDITLTGGTATIPGTYASGTYGLVDLTGASTLTVDAPLTVTDGFSVGDSSTLVVNTDVTLSSTASAGFFGGGSLALNSGTFGGGGSLYLGGANAFQRTGGRYHVDALAVDGATANFTTGDSITRGLSIFADANFTIGTNLVLTGTNPQTDGLYVSGSGSLFQRTNGATLTAPAINADSGAVIQTLPGDVLTNAILLASFGGSIVNSGSQTLRAVDVSGEGSSFVTTAPLTIIDGDPFTYDLNITNGGRFDADADVSVGLARVQGGTLNLLSGTASATDLVVLSGSLSREAGAAYDVGTLFLQSAAMNFLAGDSLSLLTLSGSATFVTGTSLAALDLQDLSIIDPTSQLILGSFDGTDAAVTGWGLKVSGNLESQILGYVAESQIVGSAAQGLSVIYSDSTNATYVTAVPEPSTLALVAAGGLVVGWRSVRRRRAAG